MRTDCSGHATDKVKTRMSTDVKISAAICCRPPATRYRSHTSSSLAPATLGVSRSNTQGHIWEYRVKWNWKCLASGECTWECRANQAGSVWLSSIGSLLETIMRAKLGVYSQAGWECAMEYNEDLPWEHAQEGTWEHTYCAWWPTWCWLRSVLRAYSGGYRQVGWERAIELNWKHSLDHTCKWTG